MTKSRSPRSPLRMVLAIGAILIAPIVAASVALSIAFPAARVHALVAVQLQSALAREVRFGDAAVGIWPPVRLTVKQLALAEPAGFTAGTAFEARAIDLDLDLFGLLARRLVVRRLVVDEPVLHLLLHADGSTNFDALPKPAAAGTPVAPPLDLAVRELDLRRARVVVDDLKSGRRTALTLDSRLGFSSSGGGRRLATSGVTEISDLAFGPLGAARRSDLNASLAKLRWKIEHRGEYDAPTRRLALERLALRLGRTELALAGVMSDLGPHARLDFRAHGANLDFGEVLGFVAAADAKLLHDLSGSGRLDFDLGIRGVLGPGRLPDVEGRLSVSGASFHYPGAPAGVEALAFTAQLAPDSLGIGDLRARVSGQPIAAALAVTHFSDPEVWFSLRGDLDLAAVAPMLAPRDTRLGGRAALDLHGRGRAKDPGAIALEGSARLAGVSVESPQLPKKVEGVSVAIVFSPARAIVRGFTAHAGQSSFTLDATVTRPLALLVPLPGVPTAGEPARAPTAPAGVDFTLESPYLDLAELLPVTPGSPLLPNATGGGHVRIARLRNKKLDVSGVNAQVTLEPGVLNVPAFTLTGYGGAVSGNAHFDLHDAAKPAFTVKAKVDSVQADALLSAWTPAKNLLHGSLSTTLDLAGEGIAPAQLERTLTAVGLAALANGTLGPGPSLQAIADFVKLPALKEVRFHDLKLPLRIEHGRVVTDNVTLEGSSGDWNLSGAIGFDGSLDYAVSVTLPPEVGAALGARAALAAGALGDDQGRLLLDLRVTGNAKSPRVSWDTKAMRDRLAGRASQALEGERAKLEAEARALLSAPGPGATDSARAAARRYRKAVEDSLRNSAGDLLKRFFGGARDTTRH